MSSERSLEKKIWTVTLFALSSTSFSATLNKTFAIGIQVKLKRSIINASVKHLSQASLATIIHLWFVQLIQQIRKY